MRTTFQKIDLGLQAILIFGIILSLVYGLFEEDAFLFSALGLFFIGVWQLISALIYSTAFSSRHHAVYLLSALLYCFILFIGAYFWDYLPRLGPSLRWLFVIPLFVQPFIASIFYFFLCEKTLNRA